MFEAFFSTVVQKMVNSEKILSPCVHVSLDTAEFKMVQKERPRERLSVLTLQACADNKIVRLSQTETQAEYIISIWLS